MKSTLVQELKIINKHPVFFCPKKCWFVFRPADVVRNVFFLRYTLFSIAPLEMLALIYCSPELG